MDASVVLLIIRFTGAILLLGFLGVIAYFIYKDIQIASQGDGGEAKVNGILRVLSSSSEAVAVGDTYPLSIVSGIGRSPENLIVIDDEFTSGKHALILYDDEKWLVEDLGSRNGTLLNDLPLESQTVIVAGDVLTVGKTKFKLEL